MSEFAHVTRKIDNVAIYLGIDSIKMIEADGVPIPPVPGSGMPPMPVGAKVTMVDGTIILVNEPMKFFDIF